MCFELPSGKHSDLRAPISKRMYVVLIIDMCFEC